ncbi:hypothetical protein Fmac_024741 [Flemingia macrophylla]|uniref:Retrotransposon Copia-like N-terminal domain-containing protein n=1 Tax=Flemingia macrophylla TaxID=520843 RepID=A0ABD1LQT5_9FABA
MGYCYAVLQLCFLFYLLALYSCIYTDLLTIITRDFVDHSIKPFILFYICIFCHGIRALLLKGSVAHSVILSSFIMSNDADQTLGVHSHLYLHPSENPAISLVSPLLDSTNYHSWSRSMLTALSAKNKVEFVDGTSQQPSPSDPLCNAWRHCNNMVVSWLVHSVSTSIRHSILWMDRADEIWKDLKSRYSQGDLLHIYDLQLEASSMRQGELSITDFFTKLRVIWDELENFRPDPICTCSNKCSCEVSSIIAQRKLEDRALQFLRGLKEQYINVRSHVLLMDPLPSISKIFSYVVQQERQLLGNDTSDTKVSLLNSVNTTHSSCTHCGRAGHTENVCYRKHGFPSNTSNTDGKTAKPTFNRNGKLCTHCGRTGHTIDVCYRKHGFPPGHKLSNSKTNLVNSTVAIIVESLRIMINKLHMKIKIFVSLSSFKLCWL